MKNFYDYLEIIQESISEDMKQKAIQKISQKISSLGFNNKIDISMYDNENMVHISIPTSIRGPRIDHGGGEDGEDWLDEGELREVEDEYLGMVRRSKQFKNLKETFKYNEDYKKSPCSISLDYGEKGHVFIDIHCSVKNLEEIIKSWK